MKPTRFPQQTVELQPPAGMTEAECGVLAVHRTGVHCISRWEPSWRERLALIFGAPVWLWVWSGDSQPPVALTTESPFAVMKRGEEPATGEPYRKARASVVALLLLALPLILGAKGCSESDPCRALREAAEAVCKAAPGSASCASLRQQLESCDVPTPPPTPKPDPAPPPVNCLTHPTCPDGQHCEQGVGCVPDPLPDPPKDCRTEGCPPGQSCRVENVHGSRSGDPSTWTEGQMARCVPDPEPPECRPGEVPVIVDGAVTRCDPAPAEGCSIDGEPGAIIPGYAHALGAEMNAAMAALRPDCPVGGRCVLTETRQAWQALVIAELRRRGICAGQHTPGTDEIAVSSSVTAPREGWHVYAEGLHVAGTIVWAPQAARPVYAAPASSPPPPATPPGESCPAEPCPLRVWTAETLPPGWGQDQIGKARWGWKCHEQGRLWEDCTPVVLRDEPYCRRIGMSPKGDGTLRASCPMRPDGHPEREVVEQWLLGGAPVPDGEGCDPEGRPAFAVPRGSGKCRLCSADGAVCSERF